MANEEAMNQFLTKELDRYLNVEFRASVQQLLVNYLYSYHALEQLPRSRMMNFARQAHKRSRKIVEVNFPLIGPRQTHPLAREEITRINEAVSFVGEHFPEQVKVSEALPLLFNDDPDPEIYVMYALIQLNERGF